VTDRPGGEGRGLRVLLAGGGTAGHIEPALSLADALVRRFPDATVVALGVADGLEAQLVPARGYELRTIPRVPLPRGVSSKLFSLPLRLRRAVAESRSHMRELVPDVVVGFGGYVALPAYLAARRLRCPIVVHEANARPGLANRVGSRLTRYVAVGTPEGALPHGLVTGIPLRRSVATLDRAALREEAATDWGLDPQAPTLLVFGGSQGAVQINRAVEGAIPALVDRGIQVLHATGPQNATAARGPGYCPVPYLERIERAYAVADLALCRSGAMTCAELAAVGLPAVFVPYPHSNGEQELNAMPLVRAGGGVLVPDSQLNAERLISEVVPRLLDPARLTVMSTAAASLGHRDADEALADLTLQAAGWAG